MEGRRNAAILILCALLAADGLAWFQIFAAPLPKNAAIHFLDVGQGDSILLELAGGVKILTDAGPDAKVLRSLDRVLPQGGRYIDLAVITHPETDHFNGFNYLLDSGYRIGAFIANGRGRGGEVWAWSELMAKIEERGIPLITLGAGNGIRWGPNRVDMLSPNAQLVASSELNDTGLVQKVRTPDFSALLTADTGFSVEEYLRRNYGPATLATDILKVGHHGSKYSSDLSFLRAVHPALAAISSGARNRYGHPARETLARFKAAGIVAFRTDEQGTITVRRAGGKLKVFSNGK